MKISRRTMLGSIAALAGAALPSLGQASIRPTTLMEVTVKPLTLAETSPWTTHYTRIIAKGTVDQLTELLLSYYRVMFDQKFIDTHMEWIRRNICDKEATKGSIELTVLREDWTRLRHQLEEKGIKYILLYVIHI